MEIFTNFVKELDQSVKPSSAILMLMENLSSSSSTIGMMQEFDEDLIHKIQLFLKGEEKYNFLSGIENVQLNIEVRRKYPTLMKILEASADPDGTQWPCSSGSSQSPALSPRSSPRSPCLMRIKSRREKDKS